MSAQLDITLVWIAFDNLYFLNILFVIDMVQFSSAWLSQQCIFFSVRFHWWLWSTGILQFVWRYMAALHSCEYVLIRLISSYLCPGLVLLHTSKWQLVHQTFGKEFNPDFLSTVILSDVKVTAVIVFDTVHQALITHTGGYILLRS